MNTKFKKLITAAVLAVAAPLLVACSSGAGSPSFDSELSLTDGWAKSAEVDGMTGVFGMLENHGDNDITLLRVETDVAGMTEFHEVTADGVMQEIAGDVIVPSHGSFELLPGGNHIMLMMLHDDLLAGNEVTFTVVYSVDSVEKSQTFTVLVKDYTGANEDYDGGHDHAHDHDHDHEATDEHDAQ